MITKACAADAGLAVTPAARGPGLRQCKVSASVHRMGRGSCPDTKAVAQEEMQIISFEGAPLDLWRRGEAYPSVSYSTRPGILRRENCDHFWFTKYPTVSLSITLHSRQTKYFF